MVSRAKLRPLQHGLGTIHKWLQVFCLVLLHLFSFVLQCDSGSVLAATKYRLPPLAVAAGPE